MEEYNSNQIITKPNPDPLQTSEPAPEQVLIPARESSSDHLATVPSLTQVPMSPSKRETSNLKISIPVLNRDTCNSNTYDCDILLDLKVQKEALSGHRIKNSSTAKISKTQTKLNQKLKLLNSSSCKNLASEDGKIQKIAKMREEKLKNELKECTFAPKILETRKKRSAEEYYKDQMKFEEKKQEKLKNIQKNKSETLANELSTLSFKPSIAEKSAAMASKHVYEESRFERLSKGLKPKVKEDETRESTEEKSVGKEDRNDFTFTPSLNIRSKNLLRMAPVEEILYEDAKRRQKAKNETRVSFSYEVNVNSNSEKVLIERFYKDFLEICDFDNLCFSDLNMILQALHMALGSEKNKGKEKDLACRLWDKVRAGQQSVSSEKLLMHLMAIMKYQTSIYTDSSEAISPEETDSLHLVYFLFFENRNSVVNHRALKTEPIPSFQPEISQNSKKILEDTSYESIVKRRELRKMEVIQELEERALDECTFQPIIYSTGTQLTADDIRDPLLKEYLSISSQSLNHRAELLYNFALIEKEKKQDLIKSEKEKLEEKQLADCTFAPNAQKKGAERPKAEDIRRCVERLAVCKPGKTGKKIKKTDPDEKEKKLREWEERKLKESKKNRVEMQEKLKVEREAEEEKKRKAEEEKQRKYERLKKTIQEKKMRAGEQKASSKLKVVSVLASEEEDPAASIVNSELPEMAKDHEILE